MKNGLFLSSWIILSTFLFSCSTAGDGNTSNSTDIADTDSLIVLQGLSEELSMVLPKELLMREGIDADYNSNFGQLEVIIGDGFELSIAEEPLSMKEEKEALENDQLFSYKFETENDSSLIFQSLLPDGKPHSYQFILLRRISGKSFAVRTAPMREFNHRHLKQMEKAVNSLSAIP